jgi:hypothetical protein
MKKVKWEHYRNYIDSPFGKLYRPRDLEVTLIESDRQFKDSFKNGFKLQMPNGVSVKYGDIKVTCTEYDNQLKNLEYAMLEMELLLEDECFKFKGGK